MSTAQEITKKAKSNLAFTLSCLPKERKQDMVTFYAFCRVIDDLADDLDTPLKKRAQGLQAWRNGINYGFHDPNELQSEVIDLIARYEIDTQPFLDLIDGCASDLEAQRFATWQDLENYTYRVACCVGLISTKIFGCTHPNSEKYAIALGHALQLTNILRDVREDLENGGRIYLPIDDLDQFNYSEQELTDQVYNDSFVAMMNHQGDRAEAFYQEAISHIHTDDAKALKAAEAMRKIYHALLEKMRADNFQVFKQRYSVSKAKKAAVLLGTLMP